MQLIRQTVKNAVALLPDEALTVEKKLPSSLKGNGSLRDSRAEDFLTAVTEHLDEFFIAFHSSFGDYLAKQKEKLANYDLAAKLSGDFEKELEDLISNIEKKEISLFEQNKLLKSFEGVLNEK